MSDEGKKRKAEEPLSKGMVEESDRDITICDKSSSKSTAEDAESKSGSKLEESVSKVNAEKTEKTEKAEKAEKAESSKKPKTGYRHSRGEGKDDRGVHPGSFACEDMRKKFGIEIPPEEKDAAKRAKRKVVLLLGYLGTNYGGFQINEGQRTLQSELELAMLRKKLLNPLNFGYPFKYGWSTSGRTDKGVHACAQVCSVKMEVLPDQKLDQVREILNEALPSDIRVLDVNRVSKSFCAHTQRDRVRYQYMIPSFMLEDVAKVRDMFEKAGCVNNKRPAGDPLSAEEITELQPQLTNYRVSTDQLDLLRRALRAYEGTHSFHNFAKGVRSDEARALRYIVSFNVEEPIIFENGTEWIPTQVLGQSFLLHQIRKMVSVAIDVARGATPIETIPGGLEKEQHIRVALAPAQGLYLDMSFYGGYNRRKDNKANPELEDLIWHEEHSEVYARWKAFRNGVLMKHVVEEEAREGNFIKYLFQQEFIFDYKLFYKLKNDVSKKGDSTEG